MTAKDDTPAGRPLALTPAWRTAHADLHVLLVIHSLTAATRIADVLPALYDPRVQLYCTRTTGGVFANGLDEYLREAQIRHISWEEAKETEFDLAITASLGDDLHELKTKILRIPHGNGYNKKWSQESGVRSQESEVRSQEVFGLSDNTLKHQGRLVPSSIALSHSEQFDRLAQGCPDALPLAFLSGDPCYDRLLAGVPHRLTYRKALGLRHGQKLITVNSTWKDESLYGSHPGVITELLARLPYDHYRVALVLHPNVWSSHGPRQIRIWQDEALRSGLLLIPPHEGWRAAVIAADLVLSDYGSVSVYAAALGRPLLLSADGRDSVDPDSALGRLYAVAHPLDPHATLVPQFEQAEKLRELTHETALTWVSSAPGRALDLIRAEAYRLMGATPPPGRPRLLAPPEPEVQSPEPTSLWVRAWPTDDGLAVHRGPAPEPGGVLVCSDAEMDHRLAAAADVLTIAEDALPADERLWSETVFAHRPGALLTAVYSAEEVRLRTRDGSLLRVRFTGLVDDPGLVAGVLAERLVTSGHAPAPKMLAALAPLHLRLSEERTLTIPFETAKG